MTKVPTPSTHLLRLLALGLAIALAFALLPLGSPGRTIGWAVYQEDTFMPRVVRSFLVFGVVSMITTIYALFSVKDKRLHALLWLLWAVVPPLWFLTEYFVLFPKYGKTETDAFSMFRYGQELAAKLWAAGVAICTGALVNDLKLIGRGEGFSTGGESRS